ncbi:hypothetical protein [Natrinema ejinorense]|uniref:Cardiolipin synthase N-terminal domain-containing protein n=1 Tax=Natrinema ejinorense TaxID=373386 RepID=A0A2A5QYQ2_9EURY|nr:hypothetical protein [Natrinema ejinorense]PCR91970.1 hypothetical protein CP557_16445 [Natrinema ejinorense]
MRLLATLPLQAGAEEIGTNALIAMAIGTLLALVITIGAAYWVYKDASKRENNELAWAVGIGALLLFVFPLGIIALILYVVIRGDETTSEPMQGGTAGGEW